MSPFLCETILPFVLLRPSILNHLIILNQIMEKEKLPAEQIKALKAQLKVAQKELKKEKMKTRGMELLIQIAEVDHQIKVKKNGRKASKN